MNFLWKFYIVINCCIICAALFKSKKTPSGVFFDLNSAQATWNQVLAPILSTNQL
jgi:hypothetical protein